ncbi:MAG: hypothetical protein E7609_06180 [Ruminococcaceae bacterium]|nr:hypothetical protein [Oscillospiraceae bacterium]
MNFLPTLGIGVLTAVSALVLRECKSPLAPFLTLSGGILLLSTLISRLTPVVLWADELLSFLPDTVGETVGKVLAAGFLCGTAAEICTDLGAPTVGAKLELVGKIEILLFSLPLLKELFSRVEALLS